MPASIESLGTPLAYPVDQAAKTPAADAEGERRLNLRTELRALVGMQKEALVHDGASGHVWRMACDEGPYLQGTDLAPFPLAFFTAGFVASFLEEVLRHAANAGAEVSDLEVTTDHFYTMQGSALRGDMIGGAKPVQLGAKLSTNGDKDKILRQAIATSPAEAYLRDGLSNRFSLTANDQHLELDLPQPGTTAGHPKGAFVHVPQKGADFHHPDLIQKLTAAEVLEGVEGGAGSSLKSVQDRTLHVRGEAKLVDESLKEIQVRLFKPIGSTFRFLSDSGATAKAPSGPAYLVAGIGFCFMTQIGRYAHITRRALQSYNVVQDTSFVLGTGEDQPTVAQPVDTHVFLGLTEANDVARRIVNMSERTCFLHAAMRGEFPTEWQ